MKTVFIAVMLGSMAGWVTLLIYGFNFYYENRCVAALIFWILSGLLVILGVFAFNRASKLGRAEDRKSKIVNGDWNS